MFLHVRHVAHREEARTEKWGEETLLKPRRLSTWCRVPALLWVRTLGVGCASAPEPPGLRRAVLSRSGREFTGVQ